MPFICTHCGEKNEFQQSINVWGRCNFNVDGTAYLDGQGDRQDTEWHDNYDYEDFESEDDESTGDIECASCSSEATEVSDEIWEEWEDSVPLEEQEDEVKEMMEDEGEYVPEKPKGVINNMYEELINGVKNEKVENKSEAEKNLEWVKNNGTNSDK